MSDCCTISYNEIRRVSIYNKYCYYDSHERPLPECMENGALSSCLTLLSNLRLATSIRIENNTGGNEYLKAMQEHNA